MDRIARHLIISGRVQGVGYRYATLLEARRLGLSGWVRNRREGTVEVVIAGPTTAADALIEWVQHGPPAAHVTDIQIKDWPDMPIGKFEQLPTV